MSDLDNIIKVVCPTQGCHAILSFKAVPNYQKLSLTCPMCKQRHLYSECQPFNPAPKPAPADETQVVKREEETIVVKKKTVIIKCLDSGEKHVLKVGKNIIGRAANPAQADITFQDSTRYMGRRHAEINVIDQGMSVALHIKDLESKNGTFVKGVKIGQSIVKLPLDTEFVLGKCRFTCLLDASAQQNNHYSGHEPTEII